MNNDKKNDKKPIKQVEKSSTTNNQQIQSKLLGTNVNEINIEKFRDLKQNQNFNLQGKLNSQIVKTISNKFGLDIVFVLDLSNQKIGNIDCLTECIHLVQLNLQNNSISDISPLKVMKDLAFLNISNNQITQLDLGELYSLQNLQAKGNFIKSVKSIEYLDRIRVLRTLYLQCPSGDQKNPICDLNNYRNVIFNTIKALQRLDGYTREQEFNTGQELQKEQVQIKIEIPNTGPWYVQQFPKVDNPSSVQLDDKGVKQSIDETKKLISNIEMKLALLN
ncbi:unnamed protein product [Paramecium primaurelia]|uniref:Leucine-rich repeat protein n=1 Tax=Paramecium primaurelia TaxID=5886 RepID=A0A8S1M3C9_PARPR|nr:unnamed protein product [Paramecium primaurelia]